MKSDVSFHIQKALTVEAALQELARKLLCDPQSVCTEVDIDGELVLHVS